MAPITGLHFLLTNDTAPSGEITSAIGSLRHVVHTFKGPRSTAGALLIAESN